MLSDHPCFPILLSTDLEATRAFYNGVLGLPILREDPGDRIVFGSGGGTQLAVTLSTIGTSDTQTHMAWRPGYSRRDRGTAQPRRAHRGVRGPGPSDRRRRRRHGPFVGRLVHRSQQKRAGGRRAQELNAT